MPHMNADSVQLAANLSRLTASDSLNVVLACRDYSAGMHALCLFDRLFSCPEGKIPAGAQSIWKFDMLGISALREIAAQEGAAADLVIISTHASARLPDAVKTWFKLWTERRSGRTGAVVLVLDDFGGNTFVPLPVESFIQECVTRAGMSFAVHRSDGFDAFGDFETAMNPAKRARTFAAFRENLFGDVFDHLREWSAPAAKLASKI